jgi:hypothetical protein
MAQEASGTMAKSCPSNFRFEDAITLLLSAGAMRWRRHSRSADRSVYATLVSIARAALKKISMIAVLS